MIVIGTDTHKRTHTCGAVFAAGGRPAGGPTASAREPGLRELLARGRESDEERVWAIEDRRHVPGSPEHFLVASGERVVRVPPKPMGESRRGERAAGRSDPIDAPAIARAALREGPETLPTAHLDEDAPQVELLPDHREDLVKARSEDQCRLRRHLHDLRPGPEIPAGALDRILRLDRLARRLSRAEQGTRVQIAREPVDEIRRRTRRAKELEREIAALVEVQAPWLPALKGCGSLTAAKLIAGTAGAGRLSSDSKFARLAGVAPIPASSGMRTRHRLDRGGNRRLNCAPHRIAVTQGRVHPPARELLARKQAEGKSRMEALRCLRRHPARRVWRLSIDSERGGSMATVYTQRDLPAPQIAATA